MEISSAPARDVYGRMRRLSQAIDDRDSSFGQRRRWTAEYVELSGDLVGSVGARAAGGALLLDRASRRIEPSDGHAPHVGSGADSRTDLLL